MTLGYVLWMVFIAMHTVNPTLLAKPRDSTASYTGGIFLAYLFRNMSELL